MTQRQSTILADLVRELRALPRETEWVEFKQNKAEPDEIGEYVSALSNSAALLGKTSAYLVWGVRNEDHAIVGTTFDPQGLRIGNEELESWLLRLTEPKIDFRFHTLHLEGLRVVLLEIGRAARHPVRFKGQEYVRVGSYKKKLKDYPEKERSLWRVFDRIPFEDLVAVEHVSDEEVVRLLDYPAYFELLEVPLPVNRLSILEALASDRLILRNQAGAWDVTNLGAALLAKRLDDFRTLRRKAVRVIQYRGVDRTESSRELEIAKGYASGFEGLVGYVNGLLPANEVVGQAFRRDVPMFPEIAVRELVANALIHQDFSVTGAGPTIEIFADRIEITNPGEPLVDTMRFVDTPPQSRNEALASLMRRFRICEERGSGVDKVVAQVELYQLPAPIFEKPAGFTRAVLFAHKPLTAMDRSERVRACYLHACLCFVMRKQMTNTTLRGRFGVEEHNRALVSRLLREAVEADMIVQADPSAAPKLRSYLPFWAAPSDGSS